MCVPVENESKESFLEAPVVLKSQRRIEMELGDCMAGQVLVFGFVHMHETLALCVEFPLVACVGGISTITSHASYLIKTTTMYLIIKPFNIVLYILSIYT